MPQVENKRLYIQDPPRLSPVCFFIPLVLIYILYNKTVVIRVEFMSCFSKLSKLRGVMGTSGYVVNQSEVQVSWGLPNWWQGSKVRAVSLETVPLMVESDTSSACLASELHCNIASGLGDLMYFL